MPRDMAVKRPRAGVIRIELKHHVPVRDQILRVAPLGILRIDDGGAVPLPRAFV